MDPQPGLPLRSALQTAWEAPTLAAVRHFAASWAVARSFLEIYMANSLEWMLCPGLLQTAAEESILAGCATQLGGHPGNGSQAQ